MRFTNFMRIFHKISFKDPISKAMPSIVDINAQLDWNGYTMSLRGTGWLWKNNLVMSCYQNFHYKNYELSMVCVKFYDGRTMFARLHLIDHLLGIVILELEKHADAPIAKYIVSDVTKVGDVVMIIGSGNKLSHIARVGIICNKRSQNSCLEDKYGDHINLLQINCVMPEATLGSLLINQDGVAIGMIVRDNHPFAFAIPINMALQSIRQFIIFGKAFDIKTGETLPETNDINTSKLAWGLISFLKGLIKKLKPWN